jgi:ABC-type phosphate transport system substrate-binding protein
MTHGKEPASFNGRRAQEAVVSHWTWRLVGQAAVGLLLLSSTAFAGDFVFVRSAQNDVSEASKEDLKEIFTGKKTSWKNGQKVELGLAASGSPELKWLAQELLGTGEEILMAKIKQEVFKGDMRKPTPVASAQECLALVKKNPGGVCLVDADSAKGLPDGTAILKFNK